MKLTAISDTHDEHEKLTIGPTDILIHAGDATNHGYEAYTDFLYWFVQQPACYKILVPGNHDSRAFKKNTDSLGSTCKRLGVHLLMDTTLHLRYWDLRIYGSHFFGSKNCKKIYKLQPCDLLITHEPPFGIADQVYREPKPDEDPDGHLGSKSLLEQLQVANPKIHCFGHIHEQAGVHYYNGKYYINAASKNRAGLLVNPPINFEM